MATTKKAAPTFEPTDFSGNVHRGAAARRLLRLKTDLGAGWAAAGVPEVIEAEEAEHAAKINNYAQFLIQQAQA